MAKREENHETEIKDKLNKTIVNDQNIVEQMEKSFMDYAMSVIVARALPDVRDGLKPVHRRILYAMNELNITHDKPYKKSARIVGEVMGKYHPHGDASIYDAMVRMAQDFSIRYELVDGHGNFGSIDGDKPAAMRYTEARLTKISGELLRDIEKQTVRFIPNYDESESEPSVLPAHFPNLLVNGTSGIAVGMATNIPPHNLVEVINALVLLIEEPQTELAFLMEILKGPDFPTSAIILGDAGIRSAYETGRGSISIRAKAEINYLNSGKAEIIISELPYMVNKANLIEKIAQLVQLKEIEGIADLRDESSREGIRIFIETKKTAVAEVVLNRLFKLTALQTSFGINMVVIDDGEPKLMNLEQTLKAYLKHQIEILKKATQFDLDKAEKRAHILIGLEISISNIDKTIAIIRNSKSNEEAGQKLRAEYQLDEVQSKAILDMRLGRLTALEQDKIKGDLINTRKIISQYRKILESEEKQKDIIKNDLLRIKEEYGDERRTVIDSNLSANIDDESLIPQERIVITISQEGYLKRINLDEYHSQRRGGVGVRGASTYEEDVVDQIVVSHTHEDNLFFTSFGKVYRVRGHQIPRFSRQAKGIPIINLLPLEKKERVNTIIPITTDSHKKYLFFVTKQGIVKKTSLEEYKSIRQNGKIAIKLRPGDELLAVKTTSGNSEILLGASNSRVVRFNEQNVRSTGRQTSGVFGINLKDNRLRPEVVGVATSEEGDLVLAMGLLGNGKLTPISEYRKTKRGAKGVKTIKSNNRKVGKLVAIKAVRGDENLLIMTNEGLVIRFPVEQIRETSRNTVGVKLVNLREKQFIQDVSIIRDNYGREDEAENDEPTDNSEQEA